jgi:hypothetical protein
MAVSVRAGAAALPHSQVHILPGQGHEAMYAAPDMLAAAIVGFLAKNVDAKWGVLPTSSMAMIIPHAGVRRRSSCASLSWVGPL